MHNFTRRESLAIGAAALGAATLPLIGARAADEVPTANVPPPALKIEKGAHLRVLRPAKFVQPDETIFRANTKKYTEATGIPVRVDFVSWEDLRPQTAVTANTGAGPDIILGFSADPQIYAEKLTDMTDVADYLGKKYGGWFDLAVLYGTHWKTKNWISLPMGGGVGPTVYRMSWVKQAGYDKIPDDLNGFLSLCQKLKQIGHPCGFSLGHAIGDANGFCYWLLWSHGGFLVDENGKVAINSKETIAALKYAKELYPTMIPGTLAWNDSANNKAYAAGRLGLTFNGVSIYYVLKNSPDKRLNAIAADTNHQTVPFGVVKSRPQTALVVNAMLFRHSKYPNAAKDYLRFMMEAPQYGPWLSQCLGYWSNPLKAYSKMAFWHQNPKLAPYAVGMDTSFYDGYKGPVTPASSAVAANYTIVDMFAEVASGNASPESAAKRAAQQVERYYKS